MDEDKIDRMFDTIINEEGYRVANHVWHMDYILTFEDEIQMWKEAVNG